MGCHFKYYMIFFQKGILTKHFKCLFSKVPRIKKKYQEYEYVSHKHYEVRE